MNFLWIWDLPIQPKIKFFLWKICLDGLPTKSRLEKSHIFLRHKCSFCNNCYSKDASRLLFHCPFTKDAAFGLRILIGLKFPRLMLTNLLVTLSLLSVWILMRIVCKLAFTWWFVWFSRNRVCFDQERVSLFRTIPLIRDLV